MAKKICLNDWVCCTNSIGYEHNANGKPSTSKRHFAKYAIGKVKQINDNKVSVWLIGTDKTWELELTDVKFVDVTKTGDKHKYKICNTCHCLLPTTKFARNQTNKHGIIRRPSCMQCRTDIDKRPAKTKQAKDLEKKRPKIGDYFKCPICARRSIAGITKKVVADHNHHTGNIRDFICDSCNTGLGRFMNGENYLANAIEYLRERDSH